MEHLVSIFFFSIFCLFGCVSISTAQENPSNPRAEWDSLMQESLKAAKGGDYFAAIALTELALQKAEQAFGPEDATVASSLNNLAYFHKTLKEYVQAEEYYKRCLDIRKKLYGLEHPAVATSINNLASLYYVKGDYAAAEPLFKEALEVWKQTLGPNHPNVAICLENLAMLYQATNRQEEAQKLEAQAQAIRAQNQ
ncbi:MAG: hypothetical protein PWR24_1855 [Desulfonauticus sp.]|jgi:tetratricopeptide (TPR) repeat protein|nr:hypothetical protein [Desulfonauticus sp.]